ncbi:MAG: chemotaxis protein MotB [Planctomycetota bacterium]|jgi:chemotaxis protein MotB
MAAPKTPVDESLDGAPLYMVSFGDMMTIMLTFFILLCSYSKERQAGFVSDGVGSFKNVVNAMGLPGVLPGNKYPIDLGAKRARYRPVGALNDEFLIDEDGRLTDLNRDKLRDVIKEQLSKKIETRVPIVLIFDRKDTALSKDHTKTLDVIAGLLQGKNLKVRFEGFAYEEEESESDTRGIAAGRALSAARYLNRNYGIPNENIETRGWGSGGAGRKRHQERLQQDRLGRRIVVMYFVPPEN